MQILMHNLMLALTTVVGYVKPLVGGTNRVSHICRCLYNIPNHMNLIQVGYLGIDVSPTSLPQWSTLLFLLIIIIYKRIAPNTIYYHSHTFSLMIYKFSIMYTAWCLTLYHNPIYCWVLSIYNYFNLLPIPL